MSLNRPDILFIMTDQQRFDTIAALGNSHIYTPNMDRLVRRGISFSKAYATCPVCVHACFQQCESATCGRAATGNGSALRTVFGSNHVTAGIPDICNRKISHATMD